MKKAIVCILLALAILGLGLAYGESRKDGAETDQGAYLRLHVRANSNSEEDQAVKYLVRDAIVTLLTPFVAECHDKEEAIAVVRGLQDRAVAVAVSVLEENGFGYGARASVREEQFPTRVYEGVTLPSGVYDAFIIELGEGVGDNWWCVVYPPLCFTGGNGNIVYKSKIKELIEEFFSRQEQNRTK